MLVKELSGGQILKVGEQGVVLGLLNNPYLSLEESASSSLENGDVGFLGGSEVLEELEMEALLLGSFKPNSSHQGAVLELSQVDYDLTTIVGRSSSSFVSGELVSGDGFEELWVKRNSRCGTSFSGNNVLVLEFASGDFEFSDLCQVDNSASRGDVALMVRSGSLVDLSLQDFSGTPVVGSLPMVLSGHVADGSCGAVGLGLVSFANSVGIESGLGEQELVENTGKMNRIFGPVSRFVGGHRRGSVLRSTASVER